jgi:Xaa-Pro dipeptidase
MTSPSVRPQPVLLRLGGGMRPTWLSAEAAVAAREVDDRPFPDAEYAARLGRVRHAMSEAALDAMVVFRPSSIEYLCGYHTAEKAPQPLLLTASETVLYIPDLEVGRALASARVDQVLYSQYADALRDLESFVDHATGQLPRHARVGVELSHASTPPQAVELLRRKRVELVHTDHLVERVRLVLSPQEIRCVEQAAVHTQAGVDAAVAHAREPERPTRRWRLRSRPRSSPAPIPRPHGDPSSPPAAEAASPTPAGRIGS